MFVIWVPPWNLIWVPPWNLSSTWYRWKVLVASFRHFESFKMSQSLNPKSWKKIFFNFLFVVRSNSNDTWHGGGGMRQCHQMTNGEGVGLPKCHVTFFPEFLSPIFLILGCFQRTFFGKIKCHITRGGGGTDLCRKGGRRGQKSVKKGSGNIYMAPKVFYTSFITLDHENAIKMLLFSIISFKHTFAVFIFSQL